MREVNNGKPHISLPCKTRQKECLQDHVLIQKLQLYILQGIVDTLLAFTVASGPSKSMHKMFICAYHKVR